jgi:hypothetical protein
MTQTRNRKRKRTKKELERSVLIFFLIAGIEVLPYTSTGIAAPKDETLKLYSEKTREESFLFTSYKDARVANLDRCVTNCVVKPLLDRGPSKGRKFKIGPGGQSPASVLCNELKGLPLTFYEGNLDEREVCIFPEGDMILAWDLYSFLKKSSGDKSHPD